MFQVQSSWHASACGVSKLCRSRRGECMPISQEGAALASNLVLGLWLLAAALGVWLVA